MTGGRFSRKTKVHDSAAEDFRQFVAKYLDQSTPLRIADVGSYNVNGALRELLPAVHAWHYVGFDLNAGPNVDWVLDSEDDWHGGADFDVVISSQTTEHVRRPWKWIRCCESLLKPGGLIYVSTPNTIGFHEYPIDCWRVWPDGMRALFDWAAIQEVEVYAAGMDTTGIGRKPL
jgi:SAM-dependent methyltransferase